MWHWLAATPAEPNYWIQYGIAAPVIAILCIACYALWKWGLSQQKKYDSLAERAIPLLAQTVELLEEKSRQTVERQRNETSQMLTKIERLIDRFEDRR